MKNQRTFTAILTGTIFAMAMLLMTVSADAQVQLRYQTRYSKSDVSRIITRLENSSDKFRRDFDKAMDKSRRNGSNAEDRYNDNVRDYENSLDALRSDFNRTNSWWETRNQTSDVIREAQVVNNMMNAISFRRKLENQWNTMRNDLNTLADTYDLPGLNGGGWNGGNNGGGWNGNGNMISPPSWARGTFYGTAPDGSRITLTMGNNGQVTALVNGSPSYGAYYRNGININGAYAHVTKWGDGLSTKRTDNGEVINYSRNGWGNGDNGGGNGGGDRPSSWAIGSFTAQNPQTGGTIYLTVANDGQVTVNMDGNMSYGSLNGNTLNMNGATATVTKNGNGIRTTRNDNGERINYRRQ